MDIRDFKTDLTLEEEGTWIDFGEGSAVCVARVGNANFSRKWNRLKGRLNRLSKSKSASDEETDKILAEALAETVFLGFKGIYDGDKKLKDDLNTRVKLLMVKDFRAFIIEMATDLSTFQSEVEEAEIKNLLVSSDGGSG
jgi:hypothetical protein